MSAKICLVALLACAACSADRPSGAARPEQEGGWPVIPVRGAPSAGAIAMACTMAEPGFSDRTADPEAVSRAYVVRDPACTTDRRKRGRAQCSFEIGETERNIFDDNDKAARRVEPWRTARADLSYRRVGFGDDWMESWWADRPCL